MNKNFCDLVNPGVLKLQPYQPGKPIEELRRETGLTHIIKLASNENPLGASPKALACLNSSADMHRYPDGNGFELKQRLAKYLNCDASKIILGNGSDNILALAAQAFVKPGNDIVISQYAFATFAIIAHGVGANPIFAPAKNWEHDLEAMANAITHKTQLIFMANPNNPTGTWFTEQALLAFLNKIPQHIMVVMDEAYCEYVTESSYPNTLRLQQDYPNILVTRTFSKIFGLAGFRVGYGIGDTNIIELLNRVRLPFNVSTLAQAAALAALEDKEHLQQALAVNKAGMQQLSDGFRTLGIPMIPSVANFITIDLQSNAPRIYEGLLQKGIIVRPLANYGMPNHLRITIGLPEENEYLINTLSEMV